MEISIVTPSLNQGQFIEEMICSVLSQDHTRYEHIIIDGGSTDETLNILKKYTHLVWISESDKGQSEALNKGFKKAKGNWILWLNADDVLLPNALNKYVEYIEKKPDSNVIYGHMTFFNNKNGEIVRRQFFNRFSRMAIVFGVYVPPTTGTLFRKEILLDNPLDTSFHYMMDAEWFLRCRNHLKVKRLNDFFVKFRISEDNKTSAQILTGYQNPQHSREQHVIDEKSRAVHPKFGKSFFRIIKLVLKTKNKILKIKYYLKGCAL
ncbi:glycosyltransferase family 2 protein [Ulvibacterium marinum]|uniref:glycosyltransferase family 2 protein n=1 Tax=Ulvibacterium marinum TaxID=2419782 RepID=UPI001313D913|nr:glycosyltransferase family 2 protein [Ulvibacterium marinum]